MDHGWKGKPAVRTIAIINQKGGCGKTTVSINLAATLAAKGHRALLVDMDPQGHCALGLAVPEAQVIRSTADLLRAGLDGSLGLADITWQVSRCLDLAPSSMALAGIEAQLAGASDKDRRLAQVLATAQGLYDFVVIDCPPSIGLLTFNALRAADEVMVPVETGYFAMQGAARQEKTIEMLVRRVGHRVRFRVLPTMYDVRTKLSREILSELKKHFEDRVLPLAISFDAKLKEAASFGQPITEYDAASPGMKDFEALASWLVEHLPPPPEALASPEVSAKATSEAVTVQGGDPDGAPVVSAHPAMSRAAELVERARALSARTAQISARMERDPDARVESLTAAPPGQAQASSADPRLSKLYGIRHTARGILFVQPADGTQRLAIASDFNCWDPSQTPMTRDERLGVFQACVQMSPGRYRYRLVRDGRWIHDPYNARVESDSFGELNNVVEIG